MTDLVEGRPETGAVASICELPPKRAAIVRVSGSPRELPALLGRAFDISSRAIIAAGAQFAGHPFARYTAFGEHIEAEVGFPFAGEVAPGGEIEIVGLPGGLAAMARYVGPYEQLSRAWEDGTAWLKERGLAPTGPAWECYLTGPEDPGPPITEIFWPLG